MATELSLLLPLLPSSKAIITRAWDDLALCILQGVLTARAHLPSSAGGGKWPDLERLLWSSGARPSPFNAMYRRWSEAQCSRNMKDRVLALLSHHGDFDPEEGGVSALGSLAKRLKDERDVAENARLQAAATKAARLEARSRENVCQEGALGALPRAYGVDAPRVSGAAEAHQRQNQDACDLLAQNPTSQNNHTRPVGMPVCPPPNVTPPTADATTNGDRAASTPSSSRRPLLNYLLY